MSFHEPLAHLPEPDRSHVHHRWDVTDPDELLEPIDELTLARARRQVDAGRLWRQELSHVLVEDRPRDRQQLGLRIEAATGGYQFGGELEVLLAATRRTKKGGWAKNFGWANLSTRTARRAFNADQLALCDRLLRSAGLVYAQSPWLAIREFGPELWDLLAEARDLGMEIGTLEESPPLPRGGYRGLVQPEQRTPIVLDFDPVHVATTLNEGTDGSLELAANVILASGGSEEPIRFYGDPMHSLLLPGDGGGWVLRPCMVDEATNRLARKDPVHIPADDVGDFLTGFLPQLARRTTVLGPADLAGSGEDGPLVLRCVVGGLGAAGLRLTWEWEYATPQGRRTLRFGAEDRPVYRRPLAEISRFDRLCGEVAGLAELVGGGARELGPVEACLFFADVEPVLQAHEQIEVVHEGELLDYAEAEQTELRWEIEDSGERDWFDLSADLVVDGHSVPMDQLLRALRAGDELLVLDSGRWVSLTTPDMQRLRQLILEANEIRDPTGDRLGLTRYHLDLWEELGSLGEVGGQVDRWRRAVGDLVDAPTPPVDPPASLRAALRPYQVQGFQWITGLWQAGLGGLLADDMGLGKTVQTLAAILHRREQHPDEGPVLVVAPTSVLNTWLTEAARFAPSLDVRAVARTRKKSAGDLSDEIAGADLVITTYTVLRLDAGSFGDLDWSAVVLDEAQAVKNPRAKTHAAIRALRREFTLAVTGTPVENSLVDLWAMLALIAPGLYPRLQEFTEKVRRPIESGADPDALPRLRKRLRPLILRRTKELVAADLPPKHVQVLSVPLHPGHQRVYDRHLLRERQRMLGLLDDPDSNRVAILAGLTRMRQLSLDPGLIEPDSTLASAKTETVIEMVTELAGEGHRALVFSQFTSYLKRVREGLTAAGLATSYLDGGTGNRDRVIDEFRRGGHAAFLISLKAGGVGLTLTEADYVFVLDPWWNPAAEQQAIDRAHRIGQNRTVMVYRLVSEGTIEEKVVALQERKKELVAGLLGTGDETPAQLTVAEIRGLLA